jgi:hypothetical protein
MPSSVWVRKAERPTLLGICAVQLVFKIDGRIGTLVFLTMISQRYKLIYYILIQSENQTAKERE